MATKTRNVSSPLELHAAIQRRVRSGLYGDAKEVIRVGLRPLAREEAGPAWQQFQEIMARLPDGPKLTPEIGQDVVRRVNVARQADKEKASR